MKMEGHGMIFWLTVFTFTIFFKVSKEENKGCLEQSLVGKESLNISDENYNASSIFDYRYPPHQAKLYGPYGWAPKDNNNPDDYLQIDLGTPRVITAVATQGNGGDPNDQDHKIKDEWVKTYNLSLSNNTKTWIRYKRTINGNTDSYTVIRYDFQPPITAQFIRFIPLTYDIHKTMRVNVYVFNKSQEAPRVTVSPDKRSILLEWKITPCRLLTITEYKVKLNGKKIFNTGRIETKYWLKDLKPYTEYSVSVKAQIQQGDGLWSKVISTRTEMEKPAAVPKITSMKAASSNSIIIKFEKPDPDKIYGPFEGYEIRYTPKVRAGSETVRKVGNVTTHTLKSLLKYTKYSITVAVRNTKDIGPLTREWIVTTLEDAPSAPVNPNALLKPANGLDRSRVVIKWRSPIHTNGIIRKYIIMYYLNNDMNTAEKTTVTIKQGTITPLEYTITMMSCGTFSYRISAFTIKEGVYATGNSIDIPEYRCPEKSLAGGKDRNLHIPNSSYTASSYHNDRYAPHQAKLYAPYGWAPKFQDNPTDYLQIDLGTTLVITAVATQGSGGDLNTNPPIIRKEWVKLYKLEYSSNKSKWSSYKNDRYEFKGNTDSSNVVRHDLENAISARYIKFVPTDYYGKKTMRVDVYVSFQEAPRFTLVHPGERSVKLTWSVKPCSPTHFIKGYEVRLATKTGTYHVNSSGMTCNVTNLKPYTEYNVSVRAIKEVGYGVWSNVTTIRTAMAKPETFPVITNIEAKAFRSITIEWKLERANLLHGPFKRYLIRYTPQGRHTEKRFVDCKLVTACTKYTLTSLRKYTTYRVNIAVENEKYPSRPSETKNIRTRIDEPDGSPIIIRIEAQSSESIMLEWKRVDSDAINGHFQAYRIKYTAEGGEANILDVGDITTHNLTSLLKYTMYSVTIAVMNEEFVGPPSTAVKRRTLEDAPSAPVNVNGSLLPANGSIPARVVITWDRPRQPNGIIKKYTIVYYYSKDASNKTVDIDGNNDLQYTMNFTNNGVLSFMISATTIKEGPYQSGKIAMPSKIGKGQTQRNTDTSGGASTGGLVAGLVVGILLVLLFLILAFLIWKRKRIQKESYDRAGSLPLAAVDYSPTSAPDNMNFVNPNTETAHALAPLSLSTGIERHRSSRFSSRSASFKPAKPPVDFPTPDVNKLKKEFKGVPVEQRFLDCKEGSKSANKAKNRYKNIIAYDHSLVSLEWVYGETESFYINANFIHGYDGRPEAYIATQGPLDITVNEFWRMIWEQKVSSIVMLTNLQELGKIKCYQYWPDSCYQYSDITIINHKTEVFADFTIRTFFISKDGSQDRRVRQFHFTAWPDKGVPDHATAVLSFRRKVLALTSDNDDSPTVVHCSAGVGRTGTYIMIDAMLRQAEDQNQVDILNYLKTIRNDRPHMVQTVEQYIFVNMAIYDALTCGNTEVPVQNLVYALQQLSIKDRRHKLTGYAQEFQRLDDVTSEDTQSGNFDVGLSRKNVKKNRYLDIVVANANRVILSPCDDTEIGDYINYAVIAAFKERKGDYINASFVDTYREHNAFIMTQAPMENTIGDFWRMIMDYKIGSIVMLNNLEEQCEIFPQYWPLHETKTYEGIKVRLVETKHLAGNIVLRILEVSNRRKQFTVNHFHHLTWESKSVPTNPQSVLRLLHEVQKSQQKSGNSPIVVHCNNGVGRSGTFCAIASCLERVKQEQVLDVFQTIKSIRVNRPGAVETLPQYVFCYTIIQEYLDSFRDYANFGDI